MATISLQHVYHTTHFGAVCKLDKFSLTVHVADKYVNILEKMNY